MDWLIRGFGFTERVRDRLSDGTVRHGELLLDNGGVIMVGSAGADFRGPAKLGEVTQLQCITINDLLAHRDRVQTAGAVVSEISIRAGRAHSYTVDDPEGIAGTSASRCSQPGVSLTAFSQTGRTTTGPGRASIDIKWILTCG